MHSLSGTKVSAPVFSLVLGEDTSFTGPTFSNKNKEIFDNKKLKW